MSGLMKRLVARQAQADSDTRKMHQEAGNPAAFDTAALVVAAGGIVNANPNARAVLTMIPNHPEQGMKLTTFFEDGFDANNPAHQALAWVMEQIQNANTAQGHELEEVTKPEYIVGAQAEAALRTGEIPEEAQEPSRIILSTPEGLRDSQGNRLQH